VAYDFHTPSFGALGELFVLIPYLLIRAAVTLQRAGAALLPLPLLGGDLADCRRVAGRIGPRLPSRSVRSSLPRVSTRPQDQHQRQLLG